MRTCQAIDVPDLWEGDGAEQRTCGARATAQVDGVDVCDEHAEEYRDRGQTIVPTRYEDPCPW